MHFACINAPRPMLVQERFEDYNLGVITPICVQIYTFTGLESITDTIHNGYPRVKSVVLQTTNGFLPDINAVINSSPMSVCRKTDVNRTKPRYRNRSKNRFVNSKCAEKQNTRCFTRYLCLQCIM
jgi:hypothetical protein